jgi:diguanylate cyclase (GGDEF)-like protein/PAS domain S-box-containing protein
MEQRARQLSNQLEVQTRQLRDLEERLGQEISRSEQLEAQVKKIKDKIDVMIEERTQELSSENEQLRTELDERIMMTDVLHENEQQFRALVASIPGAVYRIKIDTEWTVEFISDAIEEITAYPASKFRWHPVNVYRGIIHPDDREMVEQAIRDGMEPLKTFSVEYRIIDANGSLRWFYESGQAVFGIDGAPLWFDGTIYDDSNRKFAEEALQEANKELKRLASVDGLTQIANRRQFDESLEREWERMKREKGVLSLILCDIDFFKLYNDNYGHQEGDKCLHAVAQAINATIRRPADLAARYGGEEFVAILPNTHIEGALHLAEKVRQRVQELNIPHAYSKVAPNVSLSLGVSGVIPDQNMLPKELINAADVALYEAKKQGRNRAILNSGSFHIAGAAEL